MRIDAGPIVAQATVPVLDDDTSDSLSARILVEEHRLYPQAIAKVVATAFRKQNIKVVTGARVEGVNAGKDSVELDWGEGAQKVDYLCIAAGRGPDVEVRAARTGGN